MEFCMTNHKKTDEAHAPKSAEESIFDKVMPQSVKKGFENLMGDSRLKHMVGELKLPKEIVTYILSQVDDTKNAAVGIISKEMRLFLEKTSLSDELVKLLTKISFQIKTDVRFIKNEDGSLKPKVSHQVHHEEKNTEEEKNNSSES